MKKFELFLSEFEYCEMSFVIVEIKVNKFVILEISQLFVKSHNYLY